MNAKISHHGALWLVFIIATLAGCDAIGLPTGLLSPEIPADLRHVDDNSAQFDVSSIDTSALWKKAEPAPAQNDIVGCWAWAFDATVPEVPQFGTVRGGSRSVTRFTADGRFIDEMMIETDLLGMALVTSFTRAPMNSSARVSFASLRMFTSPPISRRANWLKKPLTSIPLHGTPSYV